MQPATAGPGKRVLLATLGTRGDLNPLLAVAEELSKRGHSVVFAAPERYVGLISDAGREFFPLRPDPEQSKEAVRPGVERHSEDSLRSVLFPAVELTYRDLLRAAAGCDLVAGHHILLPLPMAAENLGIPWMSIYFAPGVLNSMYDPPMMPILQRLHPVQRSSHHAARALNRLFKLYTRSLYRPYRALRAREGFPAETHDYILDGVHSPHGTLGLFSEAIGAPQPDWDNGTVACGFPFLKEEWAEEHAELRRFLDAGDAPIVATLGSSDYRNMHQFFEASMEAARGLGRRIVLLVGRGTQNRPDVEDSSFAFVAGYAPYQELFPRACAVIHSGAVGALAEALRAGKPMLIVPSIAADQPDNAQRAVRLGVAKTIPLHRYSVATARMGLEALLGDAQYARRAAALGERIRAEDGAARAAEVLVAAAETTSARRAVRQ
jgi:rhamnosyltransferase subunit B